jgi:hypothetical protein
MKGENDFVLQLWSRRRPRRWSGQVRGRDAFTRGLGKRRADARLHVVAEWGRRSSVWGWKSF